MTDRRPPITGSTRLFGVLGAPVTHSRSPSLHEAWLAEHGVDARYLALPVDPGRGEEIVPALRTLGLAGVNVTVPFKEVVAAGVDDLRGAAAWLRAVNTVVREGDRLVGHNTDAQGFVNGVVGAFGDVISGARTVVIGAGGAGLAVGAGLASAGAWSVTWLNRSPERAERAAARIGRAVPGVRAQGAGLDANTFREAVYDAQLVVVATSGAAVDALGELDFGLLRSRAILCDLNYWQHAPPWLVSHAARGGPVQDGWPMLVHQAALAFSLFTGISPDTAHALRGAE